MSNLVTCDGHHGGETVPAVVFTRSRDIRKGKREDWCPSCFHSYVESWLKTPTLAPFISEHVKQGWSEGSTTSGDTPPLSFG